MIAVFGLSLYEAGIALIVFGLAMIWLGARIPFWFADNEDESER